MKNQQRSIPKAVNQIQELLDCAYAIRVKDISKSVDLAKEAISISQTISRNDLYAKSISLLAFFYMIQCNFKESKELSETALSLFEKEKDLKGIADAKFNLASIYYKTDHFHEGLLLLLDCQLIYKQLKDYDREALVLKSMGTIYEYLDDVNSAIQAYQESALLAKKGHNPNLESNAYNPLSGIYLNRGEIGEAHRLIEMSIRLKEANGDLRGLAFALYGRGKIYARQEKYSEAVSDFTKSKKIHEDMGDLVGLCMTCNKMGNLYFKMKDLLQAKNFLREALGLAQANNIIAIEYKVYHTLYLIAKEQQDDGEALIYLEKYISTKERIINSRIKNVIDSYKAIGRVEALERESQAQKEKSDIIHQKNIELDSFFYRVSHDLKGPINSLEGLNSLINIDVKDTTALTYFAMYQQQIERIGKIVNELINLTKMNHQKANRQLINFDKIVDECINSYQHFPNFHRIAFIKEIEEGLEFRSEWPVINTILQNLIENGIKYSRENAENPYLQISIKSNQEYIIIDSKDNGQGIEPKYQGKIFDMFYRVNNNTAGTGLGLYILKRAVERLNGNVSVESTYGQGSNFRVALPKSIEIQKLSSK